MHVYSCLSQFSCLFFACLFSCLFFKFSCLFMSIFHVYFFPQIFTCLFFGAKYHTFRFGLIPSLQPPISRRPVPPGHQLEPTARVGPPNRMSETFAGPKSLRMLWDVRPARARGWGVLGSLGRILGNIWGVWAFWGVFGLSGQPRVCAHLRSA